MSQEKKEGHPRVPAEATAATACVPGPPCAGRWYGPRIVGASSLVLALTAPGQTAAIAAFADPLIHGLHVSCTTVSAAYLPGPLAGCRRHARCPAGASTVSAPAG
jgi:hypothetical protein